MHTARQTTNAIENETIIFFKISYPFSKIIGTFFLIYTKDSEKFRCLSLLIKIRFNNTD